MVLQQCKLNPIFVYTNLFSQRNLLLQEMAFVFVFIFLFFQTKYMSYRDKTFPSEYNVNYTESGQYLFYRVCTPTQFIYL